ncbi:MAG: dipicolinate synthase subunit B [Oscillospiraceae bacterium]|nr:dipicolinate synthase subunit B [Oscillospiraceae bacterium]
MSSLKVGFALTGSFCTFERAFEAIEKLVAKGYEVTPIASFNAYNISTRFGTCEQNRRRLEILTDKKIIATIEDAEPIGPKNMFDILCVAPCTSNTMAKIATGVNDTPVTMAVKSHARNQKPIVIAVSTNDALAAAGKNIGALQNTKNYYFVPYSQDNPISKPYSMVADFDLLEETLTLALQGKQIQPMVK